MDKDKVLDIVLNICLGLICLFFILPIFIAVTFSFDISQFPSFPPSGFTLKWYYSFFSNQLFITGLSWSVIIGLVASTIAVLIGFITSWGFVRYQFPFKNLLLSLFLSPIIIPGVIAGVAILLFFRIQLGISSSLILLLIAHTILCLPYSLRVFIAALYGMNKSIEEAAYNLGANRIQVLRYVILPQIIPAILASYIFSFSISFDEISASVFLTDANTYTLPVALFSYMKASFDPSIGVASILELIVSSIVIIVTDKTIGLSKFASF